MKKKTKLLMMLVVAVMLMTIVRVEVFAEEVQTGEYNFDLFEGQEGTYLYSLDNEDNFTENHVWMMEDGSWHDIYVKYPDGKVVKMPMQFSLEPEISSNITSDVVEYNFDLFENEDCLYSLDNEDNFTENHIWQLEIGTGHTVYVKYPDGKVVNGGTFVVTSSNSKPIVDSTNNVEATKGDTENVTEVTTKETNETVVVADEASPEENENSGSMVVIAVIILVVVLALGAAVFMRKKK